MATRTGLEEERAFGVGRVLSRAFGTLGDNPVATFGIAFLFGSIPQFFYSYFIGATLAGADRASTIAAIAVSVASFVVFLLLSMLVQAALVRATLAYGKGQRATLAQCIGTGLGKAVPLIGLTILLILGIMAGFTLLVVPGVMLFLMWSVATPALVAEDIGVFAALSRSRFLTKGARWRIFGLQLLLLVIVWLMSAAMGAIMLAAGISPILGNGAAFSLPYLLVSAISNMLVIAFWSTVQASLYIDLSAWKDGPKTQDLADIFA
ncbi:hypothetical protein [Sphingobium sp. HWE2-09]|uniref:hypothetical protein n=1 Tax=Sphingobium sp. HWE2-09 TaxID=3108390 RepID=UPI002DC8D7A9|nr:hypothetical protein [Sphingobium sp. HWE2-09]